MIFLHEFGSNNPLGISSILDDIFLHPHFVIKDSVGLNLFVLFSIIFIFFYPNILGHPDNYIFANPLITPNHIVPEWYLLPFYAILRSIPNKLLGVIFMILSILGFIALPFILGFSKIRSFSFKPLHKMYFFLFVLTCFYLGCIGGLPVVSPYYELGQLLTISYFMIFVNLPLLAFIEFLVYELQKIKNKK
jgi:ubiquinol-cytochrome c reductase cytochrome b subunit